MNEAQVAEKFSEYFTITLATTPSHWADIFRIRFRVYCQEFNYEPEENFPDSMESDEFDKLAYGCLITHKLSQRPAACVRVIPGDESPQTLLPFEQVAGDSLDLQAISRLNMARSSTCEISRFAVDGAFRRRSGENATRFGEVEAMDISQAERRTFNLLAMSTSLAAVAISRIYNLENMIAMMEPFLPRLLKRSGIYFSRIGKDIDHHGLRGTYHASTSNVCDSIIPGLQPFFLHFYDELKAQAGKV